MNRSKRDPYFSRRFGFDPSQPSGIILEDAPEWIRAVYLKEILNDLTFIDKDSRYENNDLRPLGIKALHETFARLLRIELDDNDYDSWHCWNSLENRLRTCEWYRFFEFIELVGDELKKEEAGNPFDDGWLAQFGFNARFLRVQNILPQSFPPIK